MVFVRKNTKPVQKWIYLILKALPICLEQINHITISLGWAGIRIKPMWMQVNKDFLFFCLSLPFFSQNCCTSIGTL